MTINLIENVKKMMSWCPIADTKINELLPEKVMPVSQEAGAIHLRNYSVRCSSGIISLSKNYTLLFSKPLREFGILVAVYAIYLYFSIQYPVLHRIWVFIILFIALKVGKIFELNRPTGIKMMLFFAIASVFVLIRYYALRLPLMPLIKGILALEVTMLVFVVMAKRMGLEEPDYLSRMDKRGFLIFAALIAILSIIGAAVMIGLDKLIKEMNI